MKLDRKELKKIEGSFFDLDPEEKLAYVTLKYDSVNDIFEQSYVSKLPILNVEFMTRIGSILELISSRSKLDITIQFNNMGDYTEEQMTELARKSFLLEINSDIFMNKKRNRIGYILIVTGIICFFAMLAVQYIWISESVLKDIIFYIFDIVTTVAFWEAMTILVVEQTEKRSVRKNLKKRLSAIHFKK